MKIYENILRQFIDAPANILELTNGHITEVESYGRLLEIDNLVIGHVLSKGQHPDADKLSLTTVDVGTEILDIVCGASNVDKGQYVIIAKNGAILPGNFVIKPSKIRGIESNGMICSLTELGIDEKLIPAKHKDGIFNFDEPKEIGSNALIHLGLEGFLMELDLTPNRSDLLSHYGFAEDLAAVLDVGITLPITHVKEIDEANPLSVVIESRNTNSYYARYLDNISIKESPMWLKNALVAMDCQPVNNVVDITNYILYSYGIPMHAFDANSFGTKSIVVRDNDKKQVLKTLDDQEIEVTKNEILITNGTDAMALGGIMGLANSMVTDKTTAIILEVASFDQKTTEETSKSVGLRSDSSLRFERGIDESLMIQAMNHAAILLQQLAGANVYDGIVGQVLKTKDNPSIVIDPKLIANKLGTKLSKKVIVDILERLNYEIKDDKELSVTAPSYRNDIKIAADIVEEIVRIYGVNNIPNKELVANLQGSLSSKQLRIRRLRHLLASSGFNEVVTYSLLKESDVQTFNTTGDIVSVLKPLTQDRKSLRQSLINGLLESVKYNMDRNQEDVFLYEIGNVYSKGLERTQLAVIATGNINKSLWKGESTKVDFYYLKGILDNIFAHMNQTYELVESNKPAFHPYQQATILVGGKEVGIIGKIHPRLNGNNVITLELNLDAINLHSKFVYDPISKYPNIERDIAVVLSNNIKAIELVNLIKQTARKDLIDIEIFDVYKGSHVEKGYQSIAVRMVFNRKDKTLKSEDIDKIIKKVTKRIEIEFDGKIRS